jgi:DNA mismatch repair protein MutS2
MSRSKPSGPGGSRLFRQLSTPTEIHLRRLGVRDALEKLERYLNDATVISMPRVSVIHGKGTGILKAAVVDYLTGHPLVAKCYPAAPGEGDGGVTIAELK